MLGTRRAVISRVVRCGSRGVYRGTDKLRWSHPQWRIPLQSTVAGRTLATRLLRESCIHGESTLNFACAVISAFLSLGLLPNSDFFHTRMVPDADALLFAVVCVSLAVRQALIIRCQTGFSI